MDDKMNEKNKIVDILKPRHATLGIFRFMTRSWAPKKTLVSDNMYTPKDLKDLVAKSVFMDAFLEAESARQGVTVENLRKEMLLYLDEMAFERKTHVVRWMGVAFLKVCFMMKISVFVNEPVVLKLRESMGNSPVLFLPTHRSYADFCLMTYLCFHYDIDIPAVAAGMDFHSMAVLGQRMREMGAFYIRRSLVGAPLYAATLKQYVRTAVIHHSAPIEFFLEGTRSRMNMSHCPKTGMLSMALTPYFAREVADITVVPVNISYDRLMESILFAYEHLGVPKPKETTEGLVKSLQSLRDDYGNIYITVGMPISLNKFFKSDASSSEESLKPVDLQSLTVEQTGMVRHLAGHVIHAQQECTTVTVTNLLATVLMQSLMKNRLLHLDEVLSEMEWVAGVLEARGALVRPLDGREGVDRALREQRRLLALDAGDHLRLLCGAPVAVTAAAQADEEMKGHLLKAETMAIAVPVIELQLYVNPILHYLVPPAFIYLIVRSGVTDADVCYQNYCSLRSSFRSIFFYTVKNKSNRLWYNEALDYCIQFEVISMKEGKLVPGDNERLQYLLQCTMLPAFTTLGHCAEVMSEEGRCERSQAARRVQALGEQRGAHPAALSRLAATHGLSGLAGAGALRRDHRDKETIYWTIPKSLQQWRKLYEEVAPQICADFGPENCVYKGPAPVACRL